jgi:hypothetical protein
MTEKAGGNAGFDSDRQHLDKQNHVADAKEILGPLLF